MFRPRAWRSTGVLAAVIVLSTATACGGSSDDSSAGDSGGGSSGEISGDVPTLDELYAGFEAEPPSESPPPAQDKSVWWISCGQVAPACAAYAEAGREAAEALGWEFNIADANLGQGGGHAAAIRTALAANPDAIIQSAFSCEIVQQPLEEAKAQGVLVLGLETLDCSDVGGPELFSAPMIYNEAEQTQADHWRAIGRMSAQYLMRATDGEARIITAPGTADPQQDMLYEAFLQEIENCPGCEIVDTVEWTTADLAPNGPFITAFRSSLARNPDATVVYTPFDFSVGGVGMAQAVRESGLDVLTVGGLGLAESLDLIRDGQWDANATARSSEWMSWAAMDNLNRAFNGQPAVAQGVGLISVDAEHNLPQEDGENYQTEVDFRGAYRAAWGVD